MIELRPDKPPRGTIVDGKPTMDEIVATNATVHFEMMSNSTLWGSIESEGKEVRVWITAVKGKLVFTAEFEEDAAPPSPAVKAKGE